MAEEYQVTLEEKQDLYFNVFDYSGRSAHAPKRIQRMEIAV